MRWLFTTMIIWFFVWITKGWIFIIILIIPLVNWIRRKFKKKNESIS